jgi:peptidoglycan/xylan/chitin deacetylase (PgdA/CDA1 family)
VNHLHVDADDLWIYEEEYGETRAPGAASVYDDALPRLLDLFDEENVLATIFVIGKDLERASARELCRDAVVRGHEVANHSFTHPGRLGSMSRSEKEREIRSTHDAIAEATGVPPVGFRAPGYYLDRDIVEILSAHGYLYDTSILPTFLLPLMKLYLDVLSRRRLDKALGIPRAAVASRRLRRLRSETEKPLYELPVSVLPWLRLPVHSTFAFQLPPVLRRAAYRSIAAAPDPVFLFHAIDGTDYPARDGLSSRVLPLRLPLEHRLALVREALERFPASATTRATLAARDAASTPVSRLLPHT